VSEVEDVKAAAAAAVHEYVACPAGGRQVEASRRVRLGDVSASGRLRLDALAEYLQDVAADDVDEVGIPGAWVLRRLALQLGELPRFRDEVRLVTFCSGIGSRFAERRTTLFVEGRAAGDEIAVESVSIWVYIDESGKPSPLDEWFRKYYEVAAGDRKVSGRLRHPTPPADAVRHTWPMRVADFDLLAHANNAAAWQAVEEEVARSAKGRRLESAEIEYRAAIDVGEEIEIATTFDDRELWCWLMRDAEVRASAVVRVA
jgi:acyl-ACP thioesterase